MWIRVDNSADSTVRPRNRSEPHVMRPNETQRDTSKVPSNKKELQQTSAQREEDPVQYDGLSVVPPTPGSTNAQENLGNTLELENSLRNRQPQRKKISKQTPSSRKTCAGSGLSARESRNGRFLREKLALEVTSRNHMGARPHGREDDDQLSEHQRRLRHHQRPNTTATLRTRGQVRRSEASGRSWNGNPPSTRSSGLQSAMVRHNANTIQIPASAPITKHSGLPRSFIYGFTTP